MTDIFQECRERVSAQEAARYYGIRFNSRGWAVCPFHQDEHPSMSFRDGRFRCWACNASGDSIDFTGRLLGLKPMGAVERLNNDFGLNLPLHRRPTAEERDAAKRRQKLLNTHRLFEQWRCDMIRRLNVCSRLAHEALKNLESPADLDRLTNAQVLAIREQARFDWLTDTLSGGSMAEQMEIFRERGRTSCLCREISSNTPERSGVA